MPSPRPLKVFLCHAHADRDPVHGLYTRLTQDGVDAWLDKEKLLPGQDWELEIRKAVREADVVVVCLSKQFNQAGFRQKEVRLALDTAMEKPEGEIFIIPARLEECDNLESLRRWHWVDLFEDDGYDMLVRALRVRANNIGVTLIFQKNNLPKINREMEETQKLTSSLRQPTPKNVPELLSTKIENKEPSSLAKAYFFHARKSGQTQKDPIKKKINRRQALVVGLLVSVTVLVFLFVKINSIKYAAISVSTPTNTAYLCAPGAIGWTKSYVVQSDDTLDSIALTYYTTVDLMKKVNCQVSDVLLIGGILWVPDISIATSTPFRSNIMTCTPPSGWDQVDVRSGDNLDTLASRYGISKDELRRANCLFSDMLITGSQLYVPSVQTITPTLIH